MRALIPPHSPGTPASRAALLLAAILLLTVLVIGRPGSVHAQTPEPAQTRVPYSESLAQGIDRMIMCPVCPAETIDQAQVQISFQMRQIVRDMLAQGSGRGEILEFFVERYGQDILAAPPKSGVNLIAWLAPAGGVGAALVAVFFIIRSMTRREPALVKPWPVQDAGLIPYLQLVDRHLDMTRGGSWSGGTSDNSDSGVQSPGTEYSDPFRAEENG